jgi:ribosomal protein S17E
VIILIVPVVQGIGIDITTSPATNVLMSSLSFKRAKMGLAMNDTTRQLGISLGVALSDELMNTIYWSGVSELGSMNSITNDAQDQIYKRFQNAHTMTFQLNAELVESIIRVSRQAFADRIAGGFHRWQNYDDDHSADYPDHLHVKTPDL